MILHMHAELQWQYVEVKVPHPFPPHLVREAITVRFKSSLLSKVSRAEESKLLA